MKKIPLKSVDRMYKNNGQHAEQVFRFTMTGIIQSADNISAENSSDCNGIQIKSARATVCKGTDINTYLSNDSANFYAYVMKDFKTAFLMTKAEWKEFIETFGTVTKESIKNGGQVKIRLRYETQEMREWFYRRE